MTRKEAGPIRYSVKEFRRDCRTLANKIPEVDAIVGLIGNRTGGIRLALQLGILKGIRNISTVCYSYEEKNGRTITKVIIPPNPILVRKRVLLCTDISNTGFTFLRGLKDFEGLDIFPLTCSLHYRNSSMRKPDFFMHEVITDVQYDWDLDF